MPHRQMKATTTLNKNNFLVYDFETTGRSPFNCEPIQVAGLAVNPKTLQPYPNGLFKSLMRPPGEPKDWNIEQGAMDTHHITIEQILAAPAQEVVWKNFCDHVDKYNTTSTPYGAPIPCGHNINGYDSIIAERMCRRYGVKIDKVENRMILFNRIHSLDLMQISFNWFENMNDFDLPNYKLVSIRKYMGMSDEGAHDAGVDVEDCWKILAKFISLYRRLAPTVPFKGAFKR